MKLEDWYQEKYFMLMIALFVVAVFKLGILLSTVFSCIQLRKRRQVKMYINSDRKENIYERSTDEPITTKYIQPNNFYSPRVRNPRLFHTKPNEMVWELAMEINTLEEKLDKFSDFLYKHQADSIMW